MLKKIVLAATAFAFLGTASVVSMPAEAGMMDGMMSGMKCRKMAKQQFPDDAAMRKAAKEECKAQKNMAKDAM